MSIALKIQENISPPINPAELIAQYTIANIGDLFTITKPKFLQKHQVWRSLIQYQATGCDRPIGVGRVELDASVGKVISLSQDEIRTIQEKAAIWDAKARNELPLGPNGYVLREYARKEAERFFWDNLGMHFVAAEPRFVAEDKSSIWQFTINFKMYELDLFQAGTIEIDAKSGIVTPLTTATINQIHEHVNATIRSQTSSAETV